MPASAVTFCRPASPKHEPCQRRAVLSGMQTTADTTAIGLRAIGRALGMGKDAVHARCRNRLLPAFRLGRRWALIPAAVPLYGMALALQVGAHSQAVSVSTNGPGRGGSVLPPVPLAGKPSRDKKMRPKELDGDVVTLL